MPESAKEIDLDPRKYVGLSFPLRSDNNNDFALTKNSLQQARHNLRNLLLTNLGERVSQPEFGSRLLSVIFEFRDDALIEEVINEAVDKWLPYITINEVVTAVDATNPNRLNVSIDFSVASAPDATNQIVLDFNTTQ